MAELLEESSGLESTTIGIYRTAATVKGGRRFSFGALVVVGNRGGRVGLGYGKGRGVPAAIEKAQKNARKDMHQLTLQDGTLPHTVNGRFGASSVRLIPASPGTGVIAGGTARAVLELAGVRDCLTKAYGSTNQKNLAKAVMDGLVSLRSKKQVEELREVNVGQTHVDEILEAGQRFAPVAMPAPRPARQTGRRDDRKKGGRGRGRGRGPKTGGAETPRPAGTAVAESPAAPPAEAAPAPPAETASPPADPAPGSPQD